MPLAPAPTARAVARAQGYYYVATALYTLLASRSFQKVTGPKQDMWLAKTVALLVLVIGAALLTSARRGVTREAALLGAGASAALAGVDVVYVARRRIPPVYLMDALAEGALAAGWALTARTRPRASRAR